MTVPHPHLATAMPCDVCLRLAAADVATEQARYAVENAKAENVAAEIAARALTDAIGNSATARELAPELADEIRRDVAGWSCSRDVLRRWADTQAKRRGMAA